MRAQLLGFVGIFITAMRNPCPPYRRAGWIPQPPPSCNITEKRWLQHPGSLTTALRQLGKVQLQLLAEYPTTIQGEEASALNFRSGQPIWVREVLMSIEGVACLVARSVTSLTASYSVWRAMRHLHTQPLANILYHDSGIQRTCFKYQSLKRGHSFYKLAQVAVGEQNAQRVLARCSIFWRQCQPMLLTEGFLPAFWDVHISAEVWG
jgi:chorismate--pyruvate lyase